MSADSVGRRVPRAVREQQMLDAAVRVFSRAGYHASAMDDIAEAAGISKPMVYAYLGTKEELFVACLHREGTRLMEAVAAVAGLDLPPDQQLRRGLRAFFGFVAAHRDGWAVLYRQARGQQPFAGVISQMRARWIDVVAGLLHRRLAAVAAGRAAGDGGVADGGAGEGGVGEGAAGDGAAGEGAAGPLADADVIPAAYAIVGAVESLADWIVEHGDGDADELAVRLSDLIWRGIDGDRPVPARADQGRTYAFRDQLA